MSDADDSLRVACLCAAWCRLCEGYRPTFDAVVERLRQRWPALQAEWVDIEDEADLLGDLDIETFPTVLVQRGDTIHFAGTVTPQAATLERVVGAALEQPSPGAGAFVDFEFLAQALRARAS